MRKDGNMKTKGEEGCTSVCATAVPLLALDSATGRGGYTHLYLRQTQAKVPHLSLCLFLYFVLLTTCASCCLPNPKLEM